MIFTVDFFEHFSELIHHSLAIKLIKIDSVIDPYFLSLQTANAAPMRSYVSSATYKHERTFHMSILSAAQSLGMIVGPSIQVRRYRY